MQIKQLSNKIKKENSFEDNFYNSICLINYINDRIDLMSNNEIELIMEKLLDAGIEIRQCTNCNKIMLDGYVVNDGDEYYCSDTCFDEGIGMKNLYKMYEDNEAYYTQFN